MIKNYLTWPWIASIPLLLCGFGCSVFFIGTESPLMAPAIVCLSAFAVIALYPNFKDGWALPRSYTFFAVMAFWLWVVVSMFWSTIPYVSTMFCIIISLLPAFFAVCIMARQAEEWTRVHGLALWLALGSFAVWALVQFLFMYEQYGPRIHHPMLNPNNLAGLFNMGIFPAIGLFFLAKRKPYVVLAGLAVAVFYGALVVTQSRGGFYSFIVSLAVFLPFAIFKNPEGVPWKKIGFLVTAVLLIPLLGNLYNQGALSENLVSTNALTNTRSLEDRFYLWESTLEMMKDHFWLGTGLASFYFYYPRYRLPLDRSDGFFAHMDPLQFGAEMGVMAPILFYGALLCILFRTIKAVKKAGPDLRKRLEIIAPFCGMLALTGHTHLSFHLYMPGILLPLSGLLAYWYLASERAIGDAADRKIWKPAGKGRWLSAGALALIILLACGWMVRTAAATYMLGQSQVKMRENQREEAERLLKLAGIVAPDSQGRYYEYEARFLIARVWQNAQNIDKEEARKIYEKALYYLDEAEKRNPAFTSTWDLRARLYYAVDGVVIDDGYEKATALLHKVIDNNPLAADSRIGLSNIYKSRGEFRKALQVLESGIQWPRPKGATDVTFLVSLAKLKLQMGDRRAHDAYMSEAQNRARAYGMVR